MPSTAKPTTTLRPLSPDLAGLARRLCSSAGGSATAAITDTASLVLHLSSSTANDLFSLRLTAPSAAAYRAHLLNDAGAPKLPPLEVRSLYSSPDAKGASAPAMVFRVLGMLADVIKKAGACDASLPAEAEEEEEQPPGVLLARRGCGFELVIERPGQDQPRASSPCPSTASEAWSCASSAGASSLATRDLGWQTPLPRPPPGPPAPPSTYGDDSSSRHTSSTCSGTMAALHDQVATARGELQACNASLEAALQANRDAHTQLATQAARLAQQAVRIGELEREGDAQRAAVRERDQVVRAHAGLKAAASKQAEAPRELEARNAALAAHGRRLEAETDALRRAAEAAERARARLEAERDEARVRAEAEMADYGAIRAENRELEARATGERREWERARKGWEAEMEKWKERVWRLEEEVEVWRGKG